MSDMEQSNVTTLSLDEQLVAAATGALELFGIYLGDRLGLYDVLRDGRSFTVGELAAEAGVPVEVVTPEQWAATDGAGLDPRVGAWLLAMFAYYDAHGLPVGTLPLHALLRRPVAD